jgi:peptidoglycan/xylan/chitin deacetylase (PgdA/CDA1 family)
VRDEGQLLGNHTLGHKELTKQTPAEIRRQILGGASAIKSATGVDPVWFRPPFGAVNGKVFQEVRTLKLRVAMWDIDTLDWTRPGVPRIVKNSMNHLKPGAVILMHDGGVDRSQTIAALPQIIDKLRAQGYSFVTLEELAAAK